MISRLWNHLKLRRWIRCCRTRIACSRTGPRRAGAGRSSERQGRRPRPDPTPPCGPAVTGKNIGKDSRCFELRTYTVQPDSPGNIDLLHSRFREHTNKLFVKHGMTIVGFWQPLTKPDTLIYLMAYKDAATRDAEWAAFRGGSRMGQNADGNERARGRGLGVHERDGLLANEIEQRARAESKKRRVLRRGAAGRFAREALEELEHRGFAWEVILASWNDGLRAGNRDAVPKCLEHSGMNVDSCGTRLVCSRAAQPRCRSPARRCV